MTAGDQVRDHDALLLALVREHRAAHDIADRPDMRHAGAAVFVDDDEATPVEFHPGSFSEQPRRERPPADGDDEPVDLQRLLALAVHIGDIDRLAADRSAGYLRAKADIEALFHEAAQRLTRDGAVGDRQELVGRLEDHDFAAKPPPDAAEFEPDHAGTDDAEAARYGLELQRVPRVNDVAAIVRGGIEAHRH